MKILAFSPFDLSEISGNVTTLRRLEEALTSRGHEFLITSVARDAQEADVAIRIEMESPDVIHFYHAFKTGRFIRAAGKRPVVVTISGTDLNDCAGDDACAPAVRDALRAAPVLVTYNASLAERLRGFLPEAAPKLRILPKGVRLSTEPFDLRSVAEVPPGAFLFLQPGGVRPVKNNLLAVEALRAFRKEAFLVFAGPILDPAYGHDFSRQVAREFWVRHVPRVPPDGMAAAFGACDAVLNTSLSEGLSNALMEAMAAGRAILASDVPGNRDLIDYGRTGLLYRDRDDLQDKAGLFLRDPALRRRLGHAAREHARTHFSTDREAEALLEAYAAAVRA
jgi:glycosyltransferase involved in cell wall biosynthesis